MSSLSAKSLQEILNAYPDLGARPQAAMQASDFTLDRMKGLVAALGYPQQKYPSLHIAGTNGKGSVSALCAAALQAQGYTVGRFTSPHIEGALHGISIGGQPVNGADLCETFQVLQPHLNTQGGWTQFEIVTALAFLHFARASVDAAVIEVGLGGRLDATNVIMPVVSVITPMDYDHTSILGGSLGQLASEKAGIIKPTIPVVMSPQRPEARATILRTASANKSRLIEVGKDFIFERTAFDLSGQELRVWQSGAREKTSLHIGLHGAHQVENAATAFAALQVAKENGLQIADNSIQHGFAAARWPGRFEILQSEPPFVLDAAHSPAAAAALRQTLDDYFPAMPITLLMGISADKDLAGIIEPLRGLVKKAIATQSSHLRAMAAGELQDRLVKLGIYAVSAPDSATALEIAFAEADPGSLVLCCGSVFLVEMVRAAFLKTY